MRPSSAVLTEPLSRLNNRTTSVRMGLSDSRLAKSGSIASICSLETSRALSRLMSFNAFGLTLNLSDRCCKHARDASGLPVANATKPSTVSTSTLRNSSPQAASSPVMSPEPIAIKKEAIAGGKRLFDSTIAKRDCASWAGVPEHVDTKALMHAGCSSSPCATVPIA